MKFKVLLLTLLFTALFSNSFAQLHPNREFRGTWVATVGNMDWPVKGASAESQKAALCHMLDKIKEANLNVVFFQIRTECDAFYNSSKEPWSRYLTGTQGVAPGFDPLAFAVEEAHKRGLELHAWLNPYRVNFSTSAKITYANNHISNTRPGWLLNFSNGKKILNPGLPEVRHYIASIIKEVIENYAVDGIHFDDYFYPYPDGTFRGITTEDAGTFALYGSGFSNIKDWRRHNVNETMRLVSELIKVTRPEIRFGISPFGIWKSGVPTGISGMDAYNVIYADPINWLENSYVDYLTPQLYWVLGGAQDYQKLLEWWSEKTYSSSRHLYAGQAIFRPEFSSQEVPKQIDITRTNRDRNALGSVLFRATNIAANSNGIYTSLKESTFKFPAAPPAMNWKTGQKPASPLALSVTRNEATGTYTFNWQRDPSNTATFKRYILYQLSAPTLTTTNVPDGAVRAFTVSESFTIAFDAVSSQPSYWVVTELSPSNTESELSNMVTIGTLPNIAEAPKQEEVAGKPKIRVYPNPANNKLFVEFELKKNTEVRVELMPVNGRARTRILRRKFGAGAHTITVERGRLRPGNYILIFTTDQAQVTRRVLLQ